MRLVEPLFWRFVLLIIFSASGRMIAQNLVIEPPYWWVGMNAPQLELLVYGDGVGKATVDLAYPGVQLNYTLSTLNPNYLFINLTIEPNCDPGTLQFRFTEGATTQQFDYELKPKHAMARGASGIDQSDLIYLIFPDRFANGELTNDRIEGMRDQSLNREALFDRHGGDLQGITQNLDYLEALGVTALWINPVVENDQPHESYHGYAATNLYRIDERFGGEQAYQELITSCHQRGIKVIKDMVYNHWGDQHWIYRDLPDSSWINPWPEFTRTSYRATSLFDPYIHEDERKRFQEGWFDHHMPDLNQRNPQLAQYLIQHSIWVIGHFGIDAFRIDTYGYPDQLFMRDLMVRIRSEFPDFFSFGETWVHGTPVQAWFTEANGLKKGFDSKLQGVTDFQLYYAIQDALNQPFGWTEGVSRIYYTLAKDILYHDATRNVTFLDNHDLSRIYSVLGEDIRKLKMALSFLMTTRGIPSLYYGTEIGLKNFADPDGKVRQDFPGGWPGDPLNKFQPSGREAEENALFDHISTIANYRKQNRDLFRGRLVHYIPEAGVYVYFREGGGKRLMAIMNTGDQQQLDLSRFVGMLTDAQSGVSITTGDSYELAQGTLTLEAMALLLLELH
jgi:glycosidase